MPKFYVAVWDYDTLALFAKTTASFIPATGEEVLLNFGNTHTEFVEGAWGNGAAQDSLVFTVTGACLSPPTWEGLPVIECQIEIDPYLGMEDDPDEDMCLWGRRSTDAIDDSENLTLPLLYL